MRNTIILAALLAPTLAFAASWETWHQNIEAGRKAARKSGKPILVITTWKDGV
jgi:hypothetical protein